VTPPQVLALDLGTGSCRAILFDADGNQAALVQREWSHAAEPGVPGSQVFDTDRNWQLICTCIREAIGASGLSATAIHAVSSTSMREGMVLYDARGRELWACPNVDSRAGREAAELVAQGAAERIYRIGGDWISITAPARFLWLRRHQPETFASVSRVGMLADWALYRLSGRHVTDPSLGSSSGMFDLTRRTWSEEIIDLCGLSAAVFPEIVESGTVVGTVTAEASQETGLAPGTPVVAGGADTQLGLVGLGVVAPGRTTVVGGTFWQYTALAGEPLIDPEARLRTLCHAVPGTWMIEGIGFYSGLTLRWFRDAFCAAEVVQARASGVDVYDLLEREAAAVPAGANGVIGVFSNLMDAKHWVHASPAFLQLDVSAPERSGKRECIRAIEESAAYVCLGHRHIVEELTRDRAGDVVFTGGASKGTLWPQILADVLGTPVRVPQVKESTSLGAAMFAGLGAGLHNSLEAIVDRAVRFERTFEPNAAAHERYLELYTRWQDVYASMLALTDKHGLRPLWRAAGTE
jgi:autoinducer 2 (AI-2) kinase